MKRIVNTLAAGCLAATLFAAPAQAHETPRAEVAYADLDLTADADVARLDRRIRIALESVCGRADGRDFAGTLAVRECRDEASRQLVRERAAILLAAREGRPQRTAALTVR